MKKTFNTRQLTILGLLTGILLLMAYTPLGYLNTGPLAISFNVIPVALAAVTLGPAGGAAAGAVFGLTSFLQCIGVGGLSAMGAVLFDINPVLAFIQRFIPRVLDGFLLGYIFRFVQKTGGARVGCFVTGFFSAFPLPRQALPGPGGAVQKPAASIWSEPDRIVRQLRQK